MDRSGGSRNLEEAAQWLGLAAEQGDVLGQFISALLYWDGIGVQQDMIIALKWMSLAVEHGNKTAKRLFGVYSEEMTLAEITEAERLAEAWRVEHYSSEKFWRRGFSSGFSRTLRELRELDIDE